MKGGRSFVLALLIVFVPALLAMLFLHVTRDLRMQREQTMREAGQPEATDSHPPGTQAAPPPPTESGSDELP